MEPTIWQKKTSDGRTVTVHPAKEGSLAYIAVLEGKTGPQFVELGQVDISSPNWPESERKGLSDRCIPYLGKSALGLLKEEAEALQAAMDSHGASVRQEWQKSKDLIKAKMDAFHPFLWQWYCKYGSWEKADEAEDVAAADCLRQWEGSQIDRILADAQEREDREKHDF